MCIKGLLGITRSSLYVDGQNKITYPNLQNFEGLKKPDISKMSLILSSSTDPAAFTHTQIPFLLPSIA